MPDDGNTGPLTGRIHQPGSGLSIIYVLARSCGVRGDKRRRGVRVLLLLVYTSNTRNNNVISYTGDGTRSTLRPADVENKIYYRTIQISDVLAIIGLVYYIQPK